MPNNTFQQNIPSGWKQVTLGDLVFVTTGKRDANHGSPDGQYPFFTCAQKVSRINNFAFDTEAVLIAGNGDFNVKYYKGKFDAYQRTYVLSGFRGTTGTFVYQKAKQALNEIIKNNQGSSVKFIKMGDLTDYSLLLPPIAEQQKIAEILGKVDEDIAKTEEVIEATEKLKRGLMQQLFTRGIGHTKFKETKIGEIPEEWEVVTLGKVVMVTNGQVDPRREPYKYMILVAPNHIESDSGRIIKRESAETQGAISGKYFVDKGDVIYSKIRPYLKKVALADESFLCSADVYPIKVKGNLNSIFLFNILLSKNFTDFANSNSVRTGIPKINREELYSYEFALPPLNEQKKIAEIFQAIDEKISVNKKLKEKLSLLKKGLMQDLLSGKVKVNY